jgi:hypothetical protein
MGGLTADEIIAATRRWIDSFVVDMNLCPFARREVEYGRVRMACSPAQGIEALLLALHDEMQLLANSPAVETTVLIHPGVLNDFSDYLDFLELANALLAQGGWEGIFQIASFHPDYQFEDTEPDAVENYSNRSPYPMLHLLREDSLSEAVERHPDTAGIPRRNIEHLQSLGLDAVVALRESCL